MYKLKTKEKRGVSYVSAFFFVSRTKMESGSDGGGLLLDNELRLVVEEYGRLRRTLEQVSAIRTSVERMEMLLFIMTVQISLIIAVDQL